MNLPEGWPTQVMIDAWKLDQAQGRSLESSCLAMLKVGYERLSENHAFVATPTSLQNIPEGWKLVPVEPTDEMHAQFLGYDGTPYTDAFDKKHFLEDWKRMLAAAPTPPAQKLEGKVYQLYEWDRWNDCSESAFHNYKDDGMKTRILYIYTDTPTPQYMEEQP